MSSRPLIARHWLVLALAGITLWQSAFAALGQGFAYESKPRAGAGGLSYASPDPAPRLMLPAEPVRRDVPNVGRGYLYSRYDDRAPAPAVERAGYRPGSLFAWARRDGGRDAGVVRAGYNETIPAGAPVDPFGEPLPAGGPVQPLPGTQRRYDQGQIIEGRGGEIIDQGYPDGQGYQDGYYEDGYYGDGYDDGYGYGCDECGGDGCHHCFCTCVKAWIRNCCLLRCENWTNLSLFTGAQAFKGPADFGVNGNFGYNYGFNWGTPVWPGGRCGVGFQFGGMVAASDFNGGNSFVDSRRTQWFFTTGLFRRAPCAWGWQGGLVFDYLNDEFYVTMNLGQIRGELSYLLNNVNELGFWFATRLNSDSQTTPINFPVSSVTWQANGQYNFFYRRQFCNGGDGRSYIGFSDYGQFNVGTQATVPMSEHWAMQIAYNYLLPNSNSSTPEATAETWNLNIGCVWIPSRCKTPNLCYDRFRPLFTVADNGSMMVKTK